MLKNTVRFLAYTILASTLVLTQGFLGGSPLFSNDGVAVALTIAEKAAAKAAKKAAKKAKKAAAKTEKKAEKATAKTEKKAEKAAAKTAAKAQKGAENDAIRQDRIEIRQRTKEARANSRDGGQEAEMKAGLRLSKGPQTPSELAVAIMGINKSHTGTWKPIQKARSDALIKQYNLDAGLRGDAAFRYDEKCCKKFDIKGVTKGL